MSKALGDQLYEVLREGLSEITVKLILREKCEALGKTPESVTRDDLKALIPLLTGPVLLFAGEAKAQAVKERLERLAK
jgi:hypothetical protein